MPERSRVQRKMQECLDRLGLPLRVAWTPNRSQDKHGLLELNSKTLFIFDENQEEAWRTLTHEIFEYRFKDVCEGYRNIINCLIEALEKVAYRNKESFLEFIPKVLEEVKKADA